MEKVDNYPVKIAIFGAAREPKAWNFLGWPSRERMLTEDLGEILGIAFGDRIEILTGACIGVPDLIANEARIYGARVIGYSGEQTLEKHMQNSNYATPERFDELKFINPNRVVLNGLTERSLEMIKAADALVYLGGRTGTLTEYCAAYDGCDKPMYRLHGSGGSTDMMASLNFKKRKGKVFETTSALELVSELDQDFNISNFRNNAQIEVVDVRSPLAWVKFAYRSMDGKTLITVR